MLNITLNQAILSDILIHMRRGEIQYCHSLGFDETELMQLANLSTQEISDICESAVSFANIQINHAVFWSLLENVRENTRQRNTIDRALSLGASSEIIHHYFGWSSAEVSARRKLLGIKESLGRKANVSEQEEKHIWELWSNSQTNNLQTGDESNNELDLLMFIAEETGCGLTEVNRLVKQYKAKK